MTFDLNVYYSLDPDKTIIKTTIFESPVTIRYMQDKKTRKAFFTFNKNGADITFSVPMYEEAPKENIGVMGFAEGNQDVSNDSTHEEDPKAEAGGLEAAEENREVKNESPSLFPTYGQLDGQHIGREFQQPFSPYWITLMGEFIKDPSITSVSAIRAGEYNGVQLVDYGGTHGTCLDLAAFLPTTEDEESRVELLKKLTTSQLVDDKSESSQPARKRRKRGADVEEDKGLSMKFPENSYVKEYNLNFTAGNTTELGVLKAKIELLGEDDELLTEEALLIAQTAVPNVLDPKFEIESRKRAEEKQKADEREAENEEKLTAIKAKEKRRKEKRKKRNQARLQELKTAVLKVAEKISVSSSGHDTDSDSEDENSVFSHAVSLGGVFALGQLLTGGNHIGNHQNTLTSITGEVQ